MSICIYTDIYIYTYIHIYISVHRYSDIHRYHMYMNWPCWEDQWIEHGALVTVLIKRNTIGEKKNVSKEKQHYKDMYMYIYIYVYMQIDKTR